MTSVAGLHLADTYSKTGPLTAIKADPAATESFEQHLARVRERHEPLRGRGHTVAALGMFGLHSAVFAHELGKTHLAHPMVLLNGASEQSNAIPQDHNPAALISLAIHPQTIPSEAALFPQAAAVDTSRSIQEIPASWSTHSGLSQSTAGGKSGRRNAALPSPTRTVPYPTKNPVHVVVSGTKHALKIVLRSAAEPLHGLPNLRRLVQSTVAQFEMDIAELHLNGTTSQPSFSLGGGVYGGRGG